MADQLEIHRIQVMDIYHQIVSQIGWQIKALNFRFYVMKNLLICPWNYTNTYSFIGPPVANKLLVGIR